MLNTDMWVIVSGASLFVECGLVDNNDHQVGEIRCSPLPPYGSDTLYSWS